MKKLLRKIKSIFIIPDDFFYGIMDFSFDEELKNLMGKKKEPVYKIKVKDRYLPNKSFSTIEEAENFALSSYYLIFDNTLDKEIIDFIRDNYLEMYTIERI
jgi:hypothetical protein